MKNEIKGEEMKHIEKVMELTQDLHQEIEKAKMCCDDISETAFDLNKYIDSLFDGDYNYLRDADIDCDEEDVTAFLSHSSLKDLVIAGMVALCVSRAINLSDVVDALDTLYEGKQVGGN